MRKIVTLVATLTMLLGLFAGTAGAAEHGHPWPQHGHVMLLGAEWTGAGPTTVIYSYRRCVDIAGGNQNDHAHHTSIHQGRAGQALASAGHLVLPTAGLTPFTSCAEFEALARALFDFPNNPIDFGAAP